MIVSRLTVDHVERASRLESLRGYILEDGTGKGSVAGFGFRLCRRGHSYVVRYGGRTYSLGDRVRSDLMPLEEARELGRRKLLDLIGGPRPAAEESKRRTVQELWDRWKETLEAKGRAGDLAERTVEEYRRLWERHLLQAFGTLAMSDVTAGRIHDFKLSLAETRYVCNRALQQGRAAWEHARRIGWTDDENPFAEDVTERWGEARSKRVLTAAEYRAFLGVLEAAERPYTAIEDGEEVRHPGELPGTLACLWALCFTGRRPGEVREVRREWVATLELPDGIYLRVDLPRVKADRKGESEGDTYFIPPPASERVLRVSGEGSYLIPGSKTDRPVSATTLNKAMKRLCAAAGIPPASAKVFRHSMRTVAPAAGIAPERVLDLGGWRSHKMAETVYRHRQEDETLAASTALAGHLRGLGENDREVN